MIEDSDLEETKPKSLACSASAVQVVSGVPIPKVMRVRTFSPVDWEDFIEEWSTSLSGAYEKVRRFGGSGDLGVEIGGFTSKNEFQNVWENFQCKRYDHFLKVTLTLRLDRLRDRTIAELADMCVEDQPLFRSGAVRDARFPTTLEAEV